MSVRTVNPRHMEIYTNFVNEFQLHVTEGKVLDTSGFRGWWKGIQTQWAHYVSTPCLSNGSGPFACRHPLCPGCWRLHQLKVIQHACEIPSDRELYLLEGEPCFWNEFDPATATSVWPRTSNFRLIGSSLRFLSPGRVASKTPGGKVAVGYSALVLRNTAPRYVTETIANAKTGKVGEVIHEWIQSQTPPHWIYNASEIKLVADTIKRWSPKYKLLQSIRLGQHRKTL